MDPMKPFEVPTDMRKFAEQSVEQARKAFDGFIAAAHQAVNEMEGRAHAARSGVMEMGGRAMSFAERNMAESFDFAENLVRAKDVEEVLRLQTDYVKSGLRHSTIRPRTGGSASKAAKDVTGPKVEPFELCPSKCPDPSRGWANALILQQIVRCNNIVAPHHNPC